MRRGPSRGRSRRGGLCSIRLVLLACVLIAGCGETERGVAAGSGTERPRPAAAGVPPEHDAPWFVEVSAAAGLDVEHVGGDPAADYIVDSLGSGAGWIDYDGDGDPDLYLAQGARHERDADAPPDRLFRNDGDLDGDGVPELRDVTREARLGDTSWSFGVAVADYDNDGDPDIYLTNLGPNRLYRNDGDGTFTEVGRQAGVDDGSWGTSAAWSDVDRDGDLDLYVANYVRFDRDAIPVRGSAAAREQGCLWRNIEVFCGPLGLEPAPDVFYRNDGDADGDGIPRFTRATEQAGLAGRAHYGLGALFFDAEGDGDDDLIVANDSVANAYFVNRGDGTFEETALFAGLAYNEEGREQAGMGVASGDVDGDGLFDLFLTHFSHDHDTLYRNEGGGLFEDASYNAGIAMPSFLPLGWGVGFLDADRDGDLDVFTARGHIYPQVEGSGVGAPYLQRDALLLNDGAGSFTDASDRAGPAFAGAHGSRGAAFADADGDGRLDVLVTGLHERPRLLLDRGRGGRAVGIRLIGTRSARDALGARVEIRVAGARQAAQLRRNASYLSSSEPVVRFGVGGAERVESIEVHWPSGARSRVTDVEAGTVVTIREPD